MNALVLEKPGRYFFTRDWEKPAAKPGWAVVKVAFCGVCGSDIPRFASTGNYFLPCVLGHEFAGVVEEVLPPEPGAPGFGIAAGDRVAILPIIPCRSCAGCATGEPFNCERYQFIGSRNNGGFAEYCLVPEKNLFKLPDEVSLREASLIEPLLVALHCVRRSGFVPGKTAIVYGAGPIGLLVAAWLRIFGASSVTMADVRAFSVSLAQACGFDALDTRTEVPRGPFDYAFDAAGSAKALESAILALRHAGVLTVVGRDVNDTIIPVKAFEILMRKQLTAGGCWGYNDAGEHNFLYGCLAKGLFPLEALITHVFPLAEGPDVIRKIINREMAYGKVLLECSKL